MIKGILFDLDGVICDTAPFHFEAWKELADELGITIDLTFNEHLKGVDRMTSLERILVHGGVENNFTPAEKLALASKKNERYQQLITSMTKDDLLPGILPFLKDLKKNNYALGLASASHNAPVILKRLGITSYFDAIVDPSSIAKGKPAPDIFLKGLELLNLSDKEVVGIEDAYSGIEAIKSANLFAIGIGNQDILKNADIIFPDTSYLTLERLKKLNII